MTDKTREDFEAWARANKPELLMQFVHGEPSTAYKTALFYWQAAAQQSAARIAALEANEKVLLAHIEGLNGWKEKVLKASIEAYGPDAVRYKFSLTNRHTARNTFPKWMDGRWFAFTPAEDDGHIGHIARIQALEAEVLALRKDAERYRFLRYADLNACAAKYWPGGEVPEGDEFDTAIDAAIEAERGEG